MQRNVLCRFERVFPVFSETKHVVITTCLSNVGNKFGNEADIDAVKACTSQSWRYTTGQLVSLTV